MFHMSKPPQSTFLITKLIGDYPNRWTNIKNLREQMLRLRLPHHQESSVCWQPLHKCQVYYSEHTLSAYKNITTKILYRCRYKSKH